MNNILKKLVTSKAVSALLVLSASVAQLLQAQELTQQDYHAGQQHFAHKMLLQSLQRSSPNSNVFLSPLSANLALGMLLDGARGNTRAAMLSGLGLPADISSDNLHAQNSAFLTEASACGQGFQLSINNSLWADKRVPLRVAFAEHMLQYYNAKVANADFRSEALLVAESINQWADESTNGRISKVIDAQTIQGLSLLLANVTYFKANWKDQFAKTATRRLPFATEASNSSIPMMHKELSARYYEKSYQAIQLPYQDDKVSMYVVLPPADSFGRSWISEHVLTAAFWQELDSKMQLRKVDLFLPKFKLKQSTILNESLKAIGFSDLFATPDLRDLSPVATNVSYIKQDTYLLVDEEGTEAAGVTTIGIRTTAARPSLQTLMKVDRPFFVAIRDRSSKAFLFMGYIADPSF